MRRSKPRYFLLTLCDDEAKTFNVIGPVTDEGINGRTSELQERGMQVHIFTTAPQVGPSEVPSRENEVAKGLPGSKHDPGLQW